MSRKLDAVFYVTDAGREPVRDWLFSLTRDERRVIGTDIAYVQWKWPLGKPRIDHLRDGVWEIRSNLGSRIARILFAVADGELILLHGFIKKTRRTPADDIELALSRWKGWKHGQAQ